MYDSIVINIAGAYDWFVSLPIEAQVGVGLLLIAWLTLHHNSNTKKVELFWNMWKDLGDQLDALQIAYEKEENLLHWEHRVVNSVEFLAMCYTSNLVHRKLCKQYLPLVLQDLMTNTNRSLYLQFQEEDPILLDAKLMGYTISRNGIVELIVENAMAIPIIGTVLLWLYNFFAKMVYQSKKPKKKKSKRP